VRKPRFQVGDRVKVVWPTDRQKNLPTSGTVTEVLGSVPQPVYRYRVTFPDGTTETFFGFELEIES
jgi:hypothetical protein